MNKEQIETNQHKKRIIQATREYFKNKYHKPKRTQRNRKNTILITDYLK